MLVMADSIATEAAWRLDADEVVEIEVDDGLQGVVQIRVTPKTRNILVIRALQISDVTRKWHFLNHAHPGG